MSSARPINFAYRSASVCRGTGAALSGAVLSAGNVISSRVPSGTCTGSLIVSFSTMTVMLMGGKVAAGAEAARRGARKEIANPPEWSLDPPGCTSNPPGWSSNPPGWTSNPPGTDHFPPGSGLNPPGSDHNPPGSDHFPPGSDDFPPGSGDFPPGSGDFPPGSGDFPPGSGDFPPGSGDFPPGNDHFLVDGRSLRASVGSL
jgi:hypothetical protein